MSWPSPRFLGRPRLLTRVSAPSVGRDIPPIATTGCFENGPRSLPSRWPHILLKTQSYYVPVLSAVRTRQLSLPAVGKGAFALRSSSPPPAHSTLEPHRRKNA